MIPYILRSMWKQKKSNLFTILEMFGLFIVLFFCLVYSINILRPKFAPKAFKITDDHFLFQYSKWKDLSEDAIKKFVLQLPEIESASISSSSIPYNNVHGGLSFQKSSTDTSFNIALYQVDTDFFELFDIELLNGKLFSEINLTERIPVVVTRSFGEELGKNPIGITGEIAEKEVIVVGITEQYRPREYELFRPGVFFPFGAIHQYSATDLSIKFRKGAKNRKDIIHKIHDFLLKNNAHVYEISAFKSLQHKHEIESTSEMQQILMLITFLLILIALSLSGIFGYTTKQRATEIAIYRALGASSRTVRWQLMGEILTLTLMGCIPAVIIALQIPLLGIFTAYDEVLLAILFSAAIIISMVIISIYFPSRLACRQEPGLALKTE